MERSCKTCKHDKGRCVGMPRTGSHRHCYKPATATNADRIRSMSDEAMAAWLVKQTAYTESAWSETTYLNYATGRSDTKANAMADTLKWLRQPAK